MTTIPIFARDSGNRVLEVNPPFPNVDIHITNHGSDWLWAAFSLFSLMAIAHAFVYAFTSSRTNTLKKSLLIVPLFTNAVLAYTYFTYASNLGYTYTLTEFQNVTTSEGLNNRQIFYVKYIGWFLAWPFNLFAITVATNTLTTTTEGTTSGSSNFFTGDSVRDIFLIVANLITKSLAVSIFVLGLLIGGLIHSTYKWGFFTFAVTAQLFAILLIVVSVFRSTRSGAVSIAFPAAVVFFQIIVWILYPIAWGLSEGGNRIQPDSEAVFYGILDLITFGLVPTLLTWYNISTVDEGFFHNLFTLRSHTWTEKPIGETPRHSGDTAVPTVAPTEPVDAAEHPAEV